MQAKGKILIAEDDKITLQMLVDDFSDAGYEVFQYSDGSEVVEMAVKHEPDLIILDLVMPFVSGYALAGQLKGRPETTHIPIVVVSSTPATVQNERRKRVQHDVILNCVERLEKPVNMPYLLKRVESYIYAGRAVKSINSMQKTVDKL